ncbi:MAG: acyl-CoA dehydrogenase family protein [Candidatus Binatia bacterium]|nr:acyl-CoA dehydrogenase family protein [Candidatus Binatia bacterium]
MDLRFKPEHEEFRRRLRVWLQENLPPGWSSGAIPSFERFEDEVAFLREWQAKLHAAGYAGILWPKEYGGAGLGAVEQIIFNEEMARAQAPELINKVGVHNVGPTLIRYGTEEQKRRYLPKILSADEIWCQLFSEPAAGSDLASLRTRAERDGDGYRLSGQKVWTSYAQVSRWAICLARTDPSAPKYQGISYFIVDMQAPGITVRPLRQITGSSEFNEVFLDAVYVPRENLIGPENGGWHIAMHTLAHERGTGYLFKEQVKHRIAVNRLLAILRERQRRGQPVHPVLRQAVADAFIRVEILRFHNYDTMARLERGEVPGPETSLKKEFWNRLSQQLYETAMAIQGPWAQLYGDEPRAVDGGRWQSSYLYSRSVTISGGTSEIQLNIVAHRMLGLPKS